MFSFFFFFNDTATTEIYTLSLHDALPISLYPTSSHYHLLVNGSPSGFATIDCRTRLSAAPRRACLSRSEEHTSELQSRQYLVCRLLLEKKKKKKIHI